MLGDRAENERIQTCITKSPAANGQARKIQKNYSSHTRNPSLRKSVRPPLFSHGDADTFLSANEDEARRADSSLVWSMSACTTHPQCAYCILCVRLLNFTNHPSHLEQQQIVLWHRLTSLACPSARSCGLRFRRGRGLGVGGESAQF